VSIAAAAHDAATRPLTFDATVAPRQVFRSAPEQVLVTDHDWSPEADLLRVAARLPRAHARWSDTVSPYHDIVLMAEVLSQTGVIGAASVLGVPLDSFFMPRQMRIVQAPLEHNLRGPDTVRMTLTVDVAASTAFKRRRAGRPPGGWLHADCAVEGRPSGFCEVGCAWLTDDMYAMLRGEKAGRTDIEIHRPEAEPEACTGRGNLDNAVITRVWPAESPRSYRCELLVDTVDPTFFDLPLDHVPGLMLLEAMRQAATASACRELACPAEAVHVQAVDLGFARFAELDAPVAIETQFDGVGHQLAIRLHQHGRTLSEGTVGVVVR
jgi:hypothetical protein